MATRRTRTHYRGCLLGGAVGDALGAAIEFDSLRAIRRKYGPDGLQDYARAYGRIGAITDDTQMTLFSAEALIRGDNRGRERGFCSPVDVAWHAYLRWLHTQGAPYSELMLERGWLVEQHDLHQRRAPGNTCLSALRASARIDGPRGTTRDRINDSKGCGGVMRIAPVGLSSLGPFESGCDFAAITHGHPSGFVAAGCLAQLIHDLAGGAELQAAVEQLAATDLGRRGREVTRALQDAVSSAANSAGTPEDVEQLGQGWVAEEALAIGVYCALQARDFRHGVLMAVNHGGDSDSTGSITGNILGLLHGEQGIPAEWLDRLELREVIERLADDLWLHFGEGEEAEAWRAAVDEGRTGADYDRYPPN